jgi:hypothetical protein
VESNERALDKIRKLLAKAEGASTPEEAETYRGKVNDLVARYGIDQALLTASGKIRGGVVSKQILCAAPYAADKSSLLHCVFLPLGCKIIVLNTKIGHLVEVHGYGSDIERAEILYTSLLVQASQGAAVGAPRGHSAAQTAANRRAWMLGFSMTVQDRLEVAEAAAVRDSTAERKAAGDEGPSTALVLVNRAKTVGDAFAEAFPKGTTKTAFRHLSGQGYGRGQAAGARVDLGANNRVGGHRDKITS